MAILRRIIADQVYDAPVSFLLLLLLFLDVLHFIPFHFHFVAEHQTAAMTLKSEVESLRYDYELRLKRLSEEISTLKIEASRREVDVDHYVNDLYAKLKVRLRDPFLPLPTFLFQDDKFTPLAFEFPPYPSRKKKNLFLFLWGSP